VLVFGCSKGAREMKAIVRDDRTSERLAVYEIENDHADAKFYARKFCEEYEMEISNSNGIVPLGCGDFTVSITSVFIDNPSDDDDLNSSVWESESFFFDHGE
jgi:hypothetical protein